MPRTLIATLPFRDLRPLSYQGARVMDRWPQITAVLAERLSPRHAALLAEPMAHARGDGVDWYAHAVGPVTPWDQAGEAEQAEAAQELAGLAQDMAELAASLRASGDAGQAMAAEILDLALRYPGPECIYLVGARPVLVNWGAIPSAAGAQGQSVLRLARVRASAAPPPRPMKQGIAPVQAAVAARVPWWLVLLWFAVGCCAALVLLAAMHLTLPERDHGAALALERGYAAARRAEAPLRNELLGLQGALDERSAGCAGSAPPAASLGIAQPAGAAAEALRIPQGAWEADDLAFLDGCWRTGEVRRAPAGEAGVAVYCLDGQGMGFMQWGSGEVACQSPARARFLEDGSLRLAHGAAACSDGGPLERGQVTCQGGEGAASCLAGDEAGAQAFPLLPVE